MCGGELELSADKISGTCSSCGSASACSEARAAKEESEKYAEIQKKYLQKKQVADREKAENEINNKRAEIQTLIRSREQLEERKLRVKWDYEKKLVDLDAAIPEAKRTLKRALVIRNILIIGLIIAAIIIVVVIALNPELREALGYLLMMLAYYAGEGVETAGLAVLTVGGIVKPIKLKGGS
jgi:hypothetical protein